MSSAGNFGGGEMAGNSPQNYYCYGCQRTVTLTPLPNSELSCPNCNSTFLEESQTVPPPDPITGNNPFGDGIPVAFSTDSGGSGGDELAALFGGGAFSSQSPIELDPVVFINSYFRDGGATIRLLLENNLIGGGRSDYGLPENFGDYFVGPDLEQLIQQLAESDLNRHGTPPAAKWAVSGLPDVKVSDELLTSDLSQCAVCKDSFELDELVKQMPCKHMYHKNCILPWLEMHNTCPVCRYELPTDDSDYENRTSRQSTNTSRNTNTNNNNNNAGLFSLGSEGGGNQGNPRTVERRVRISLPGLLRGLESHAETSNSGGGGSNDGVNNDGNNSSSNNTHGESNSRPGGQGQARQEDLD